MKHNFVMPQTEQEWQQFHQINEDNMRKAYKSEEGHFKDESKLYTSGTRSFQDVTDWPKISLGAFKESKIYKNVEPYFKQNQDIDTAIGHSAGGSAVLE